VGQRKLDALPDPAGNFCRLSIADNGIGFDNSYAERIFEVFQRLHAQHEFQGSGIGLAAAKKIVERHRGLIGATGKPEQGAVFTILLPIKQSSTATANRS
jgi:light-regulated signal transduction histidine kinase (bacteriophytochrome)